MRYIDPGNLSFRVRASQQKSNNSWTTPGIEDLRDPVSIWQQTEQVPGPYPEPYNGKPQEAYE